MLTRLNPTDSLSLMAQSTQAGTPVANLSGQVQQAGETDSYGGSMPAQMPEIVNTQTSPAISEPPLFSVRQSAKADSFHSVATAPQAIHSLATPATLGSDVEFFHQKTELARLINLKPLAQALGSFFKGGFREHNLLPDKVIGGQNYGQRSEDITLKKNVGPAFPRVWQRVEKGMDLPEGALRLFNPQRVPSTRTLASELKVDFPSGFRLEYSSSLDAGERLQMVSPQGDVTSLEGIRLMEAPIEDDMVGLSRDKAHPALELRGPADSNGIKVWQTIRSDGSTKMSMLGPLIDYDVCVNAAGDYSCFYKTLSKVGLTQLRDGSYQPDGTSETFKPIIAPELLKR